HLTQEQVAVAIALATEQGFAELAAHGRSLHGWALAAQGHGQEGLAQLHQGLTALEGAGAGQQRSLFLALLAEAYGQDGQAAEGLRTLAEAFADVHATGARFYEAELHRLKGEFLLSLAISNAPQAEACFPQALTVPRHQQAKSLELRAATSLARLWQRQEKRDAARQLLAEVYGWFTEGFDTADLQEVKALLAELT